MSHLRLSFSTLVVTGVFFTMACGPQTDASEEPGISTVLQSEDSSAKKEKKKCDYNDPTRRYVSRDPDTCAAIFFVCQEGESPFFNECGCGCVIAQ